MCPEVRLVFLKDLIETNIRQRGIGNPNPVKLGRCIKELERIYEVREGSAGKSEPKLSDGNIFNQSDIAEMIGISVDTLNNYKKLTELIPELEDLVDTGILDDDATIIDAMDWMLTHQLSSKNLSVGEKLAMTEEFKKEVALENEKKRKETEGRPSKENCTPIGVQNPDNNRPRGNTWTDSQTAQKAGVGIGTVARYNRVTITQ